MPDGGLTSEAVANQLRVEDRPLQQAALNVFRLHPEWSESLATILGEWLTEPTIAENSAMMIDAVVSTSAGLDAVAVEIGKALTSSTTPREVRIRLLKAISVGPPIQCHRDWHSSLAAMLTADDVATVDLALDVLQTARSTQLNSQLQLIIDDTSRPTLQRVRALTVLSGGSTLDPTAFDLLLSLLREEASPAESTRAAQVLGATSLNAEQLQRLAPSLELAGPVELRDLIRPFLRNGSAPVAVAFLTSIEKSRSLLSLPTNEVSDIVKRYPPDLLPRANALLDRLKQADDQKVARLDALLPALQSGVAERGRDIFFSEKARCGTCHKVGEKGGRIGPDLTTIGANRTPRDLLESIVFPSASIVRQYESFTVTTLNGRSNSGLIVRETDETLLVQQATGEPVAVMRSEIDELSPSPVSVMPKGLEDSLSEQQLADVVAWLKSLR